MQISLDAIFAQLDQFVEQHLRASNTPGLAIALTDREQLLRVSAYGYADIAARVPITPETLFEIGSISKSFTSIALLQQRDVGRLDLHQPVARHVPWFHIRSGYAPITPHHLMSHTAGITSGSEFDPDTRYAVWALRDMEATSPPGTFFHYSNAGYQVLGLALERLLDQPYETIIQSRILEPLGMHATVPIITHETRRRLAVGYQRLYDDRPAHVSHPLVPAPWIESREGSHSIASTPADMAVFLRMLLNYGQGPQGRIISEESFALLTQRAIQLGQTIFYGYGLGLTEVDDHIQIRHSARTIGYGAMLICDMADGLGVIVMTNEQEEPKQIARYAIDLLRAAHRDQALPPPPPMPDPTHVAKAADYTGVYQCGSKMLALVAEGARLLLLYDGQQIALEQHGPDGFYVNHPDFALFLLRFQRSADQVVEAFYGPDWYVGEHYRGPTTFEYSAQWDAYPGHYRTHNPWFPNARVVLRKGALVLVYPWGDEEALVPLGNGVFRIGEAEQMPERVRFDAIVDGQALRANIFGCDLYRFFTP